MSITRTVLFDWNKDGSFTDMSASVLSVNGQIGRFDWRARAANVGVCRIELNNESGNFSPLNSGSPYYGQMVPNIPVRIEVTDTTGTNRLLTMWTTDFIPQPFQGGKRRCMVYCMDRAGQLQDADISLPIQLDQTAGPVIRKIASTVYQSGQATGTAYTRTVADTHTLTIQDQAYTFKDTLSPAANEIALASQDYFFSLASGGGGISDAAVNAALGINRDDGNGTHYADATGRHADVTAQGTMGIGWDESNYDSDLFLQETTDAYQALAMSFSFGFNGNHAEPVTLPFRRVYLYLKKVGSPTGTLTLRHEIPTGAGGSPSGTLYNASGTVTMDEADLTTSFAWYAFDWPAEYNMDSYTIDDVSYLHWLVLSTDRSTSGSDYVVWGASAAPSPYPARFSYDTKQAGSWNGRSFDYIPITYIPGLLDVTANAHGAWGNSLTLAQTGDQIALSGAVLSGGVDGPSGYISADAGQLTFEYAGDTWVDGHTNAYTAMQEMAESEFGLLWIDRDSTIHFEDQQYQFEQANATAAMTVSDTHTGQDGRLSKNDLINRAIISYEPRQLLASAVVARSVQPIFVPGRTTWYQKRWNAYESKNPSTGQITVVLPYLSSNTGDRLGAIEIVQPLTPTTDYTVWGTKDKTGPDVTTFGYVKFSFALVASGVQVQLTNTRSHSGWVHDLQVSAQGLERQATTEITYEDATSQAAYGLRAYSYRLQFPGSGVAVFAETLANFFVNRFKDPQFMVLTLSFYGLVGIGGVSLFALEIGDVITLTETQTGVSGFKLLIMGIEYDLPEQDAPSVTFHVTRLNETTYWRLGTSGYSKLGDTTVLAL